MAKTSAVVLLTALFILVPSSISSRVLLQDDAETSALPENMQDLPTSTSENSEEAAAAEIAVPEASQQTSPEAMQPQTEGEQATDAAMSPEEATRSGLENEGLAVSPVSSEASSTPEEDIPAVGTADLTKMQLHHEQSEAKYNLKRQAVNEMTDNIMFIALTVTSLALPVAALTYVWRTCCGPDSRKAID
mmetsp:Transcript_16212/g.31234  ORF Transcript_16212/g.31234 Transcript_16212/m.31234 type:complete len:190 (+) Transcript_16212:41-610(+)